MKKTSCKNYCEGCNQIEILDEDDFCNTCVHPDKFNKFRLEKQREIKHWLDLHGYKYTSYDKTINNCVKYRPDFVIDSPSGHIVFLEVDENQHSNYQELCECARMINLGQSLGGAPSIFIRYNPDEYHTNRKKYNPTFNNRTTVLKSWLDHAINMDIDSVRKLGFVSCIQLFYDQYDARTCQFQSILDYDI